MQFSECLHGLRRFAGNILRRPSQTGAAQQAALDNDVSYEDALLDIQLRNFFKAEYRHTDPPSGVFPRLLAAIRAHETGRPAREATHPAAFLAVYRVLRTSAAHRLVSGLTAAALMIAVLSSNSAHFLRGTAVSLVEYESSPTPGAVLDSTNNMQIATSRDNRYVMQRPSLGSDPEFYDPVELRLPPRADSAGLTAPVRWERFGAQ